MAPDGDRPALFGEVMIALPNSISSAVVTCAELRVDDVAAWADALRRAAGPADLDLRLSMEELVEFFSVAWTTATEVLSTLVDPDPYGGLWAAPPTVELRLSTEQQSAAGPLPRLYELVDFTASGDRVDDQLTEMAVTITAPPRLIPGARRDLTRRAMVHMGQAFGFWTPRSIVSSTFISYLSRTCGRGHRGGTARYAEEEPLDAIAPRWEWAGASLSRG
ncbi:hypothetical protein ACWEVP_35040 [Amycolatopsis sp. NPDC003865]